MSLRISRQIAALDHWYLTPAGRSFLAMERHYLDQCLSTLMGGQLLQVGGPCDFPLVQASPIAKRVHVSVKPSSQFPGDRVMADPLRLPVQPGSVDVVVLPHWLDMLSQSLVCLADVAEALVLGGHVVIVGFNKHSLLCALHAMGMVAGFPQGLHWRSMRDIEKQLRQLGFALGLSVSYFFRGVSRRASGLQVSQLMDTLGQFVCPRWGGGYLLVAQKRAKVPTGGRRCVGRSVFVRPEMVQATRFDQVQL